MTPDAKAPFSELDLDLVAEVGNIGMGHAATALSQLLGEKVAIRVPQVLVHPAEDSPGFGSEAGIGVHLQIFGPIRGNLTILISRDSAHPLLRKLTGTALPDEGTLGELEHSALLEVGNILASAYLNALGTLLGLPLLPSVPTLQCAPFGESAARGAARCHGGAPPLTIRTDFSMEGIPGGGSILFLPAPGALEAILGALGPR